MSCARGCCGTQREHYQSLRVAGVDRTRLRKITTHEGAVESGGDVVVTEHWHERQDLTIKPDTIKVTREDLGR